MQITLHLCGYLKSKEHVVTAFKVKTMYTNENTHEYFFFIYNYTVCCFKLDNFPRPYFHFRY